MVNDLINWYDTETTGKNTRYDQPIQIGVVRTDCDLNPIDEFEIRCRLQADILPAPGALLVHGAGIGTILNTSTSFYTSMCTFKAQMDSWGPSCYVAYNGMAFDEELLRHSLYRSLLQPYSTQMNGNSRFDALKLMQAVHMLQPGVLKIPQSPNAKLTFALSKLAGANGFKGHAAHDAIGDVRAMIYLARFVRRHAPAIWQLLDHWISKSTIETMLRNNRTVVEAAWHSKSCFYPLATVTQNSVVPSEWALFDLSRDPTTISNMSPKAIAATMMAKSGPKPIKRIKANGMPILLPGDHQLVRAHIAIDRQTLETRARKVYADRGMAERVQEALELYRASFEPSPHVEDQLYKGFFPTDDDKPHVEVFHVAHPAEKLAALGRMQDSRACEIGGRILFEEWPRILPSHILAAHQRRLANRFTADDEVPWMTVSKAVAEIAALRSTCQPQETYLLDEYQTYLMDTFGRSDNRSESPMSKPARSYGSYWSREHQGTQR
jgi:exodeoxyribonuclease-1